MAAVTPAIPGKWRVVKIKACPYNILSEGLHLDAAWYEFLFSLIGTSYIVLGSDSDSVD